MLESSLAPICLSTSLYSQAPQKSFIYCSTHLLFSLSLQFNSNQVSFSTALMKLHQSKYKAQSMFLPFHNLTDSADYSVFEMFFYARFLEKSCSVFSSLISFNFFISCQIFLVSWVTEGWSGPLLGSQDYPLLQLHSPTGDLIQLQGCKYHPHLSESVQYIFSSELILEFQIHTINTYVT